MKKINVVFLLYLLLPLMLVECGGKEHQPVVVSGTIISEGIISSSRGVTGPIDPSIFVRCDDNILVRIEISSYELSTGYKLEKGEQVKLTRWKNYAIIPFLDSITYSGSLLRQESQIE